MKLLQLAFALLACVATLPAARAEAAGYNVLFIIADDLRPELGCYGSRVKTPNLDRLAARGVRFDRAYCQYPVCNPSRTSFLTGLRPDTTRVLGNNTQFRRNLPDVVTLPQLFRQGGYVSVGMGKIFHRGLTMEDLRPEMDDAPSWDQTRYFQATPLGLKGEGRNLTGGRVEWCRWLAAEGTDDDQPDGQIAAEAVRWLEARKGEADARPFFLALGFHKPHDPFNAPRKYFDMYPLESLAPPPADDTNDLPIAIGGGAWKKQFDRFTDRDRREYIRSYYAGVSFTDAQVGRVLDALDRLGLSGNTAVVFLGDHGFHLGERGWWNKNTIFELCARVPLVVAAPGAKAAGKTTDAIVELLDLYPTLVELCGLGKPPQALEGRSFRALLEDAAHPGKSAAYTQVRRGAVDGRSVRTDRWRYTEWDGGRQGVELYDHAQDPRELRNLATDSAHRQAVAELSALLKPQPPAAR